jgi:Questin oxidase-like
MDVLDEAYERLLQTGPEFGGFLSNHAPMVVEALTHHGFDDVVHAWLDRYERRLEPRPAGRRRITDWQASLGDGARVGDWLDHFEHEVADGPWRPVLVRWWPRLLPGIAGGATHGAIRVGHAVRALRHADTEPRRRELGAALAYWASCYRLIPTSRPAGVRDAADALAGVPPVPNQGAGSRHRLGQLGSTPGWHEALRSLRVVTSPDDAERRTREVIDAAARRYVTHGHGQGVMLVHAVTAPTAVLRVIPELPAEHREPSADLAWISAAALYAAYGPAGAQDAPAPARTPVPAELLADAVAHGDEHVIKLADAVVDAHAWSADPGVLSASSRSFDLIPAATMV